MIFLPNKYERFCAAIRNRIQNHNISLPISLKNREILRKIYFAEAILKETEIMPIDIKKFSENLLGAMQILKIEKEEKFTFKITAEGNYLLDKKCLEILLILLSQNNTHISIYEYNSKLVIKTNLHRNPQINILLQKLNACSFYEYKTEKLITVISAHKTPKRSIPFPYESEILSNPFSAVNIFIKNKNATEV